jgi:hypothetical protein
MLYKGYLSSCYTEDHPVSNGNGRTQAWISGLTGIILALILFILQGMATDIDDLRDGQRSHLESHAARS